MKILISGATGWIGAALVSAMRRGGEEVHRLIRLDRIAHSGDVAWKPTKGFIQHRNLNDLDAVIHLCGENIFGRWTRRKKQTIRESRISSTRFLARTLADLNPAPKVFLCASAVGIYGSAGDEILTETSPAGEGFLAEVCRDWEAACEPAIQAGIRTVHLRFGMVLGADGGALKQMRPIFRKGLGGPLGSGRQWTSWISIEDAVRAIVFCMENETLRGPVNVTSPQPVPNREFAKTLGRALHRPALIPAPRIALRILFGQLADELLLSSTRAVPKKLSAAGFEFRRPILKTALDDLV